MTGPVGFPEPKKKWQIPLYLLAIPFILAKGYIGAAVDAWKTRKKDKSQKKENAWSDE